MDAQFFTNQVKRKERSLYRIAISYLHHDADAADAVQDALLKAWEKRHTLQQTDYFGTWLTRILINTCKARLRREVREVPLQETTAPTPAGSPPEESILIQDALFSLDIKYRLPLILHYLDGFPIKDIAKALGIPQGTVKSRLSRGKMMMKQILNDTEVYEDEAF